MPRLTCRVNETNEKNTLITMGITASILCGAVVYNEELGPGVTLGIELLSGAVCATGLFLWMGLRNAANNIRNRQNPDAQYNLVWSCRNPIVPEIEEIILEQPRTTV